MAFKISPYFDYVGEKGTSFHYWGHWYQSLSDIHIVINTTSGFKPHEVIVNMKPNYIECKIANGSEIFLRRRLYNKIVVENSAWMMDKGNILKIRLAKADVSIRETLWPSLLMHYFPAQPQVMEVMRKKLAFDRFNGEVFQ